MESTSDNTHVPQIEIKAKAIIKRKIEKAAEATLNVGDMQFIKVKSSITQDVEASNDAEFVALDSKMWENLALDLRRGMWTVIKNLGKTTEADKKLFDSCAQRVQEATTPKQ